MCVGATLTVLAAQKWWPRPVGPGSATQHVAPGRVQNGTTEAHVSVDGDGDALAGARAGRGGVPQRHLRAPQPLGDRPPLPLLHVLALRPC